MLKVLCFILLIAYNVVVFWYGSSIYLRGRNYKIISAALILNSLIFYWMLDSEPIHEGFLMLFFSIILTVEQKFMFQDSWLKTIFGSLFFSLHFFAFRLIYTVILSFILDMNLTLLMENDETNLIVTILTCMTYIPFILVFKRIFSMKYMNMLLSNRNNFQFSLIIIGCIYLYLIMNTKNLYITETYDYIKILELKIGITVLLGFCAAMLYAYLFSKLEMFAIKSEKMERELRENAQIEKQLEYEINYDGFTGCYTRDFAMKKLHYLLQQKKEFSLAYIDMDGLKKTNDQYGHDEGDWYILTVVQTLKEVLCDHDICRLGGDEFLILMEGLDGYKAMRLTIQSFQAVERLSGQYNKPYSTSVSYGVVELTDNHNMTLEEVIKLVDSRMYAFKKSRKKNRT